MISSMITPRRVRSGEVGLLSILDISLYQLWETLRFWERIENLEVKSFIFALINLKVDKNIYISW